MSQASIVGHAIACPQCGYDLRATAIGGTCPECGLPVRTVVEGIRVDGKKLVVRDETVLPARCIKTNEPVKEEPITKKMYWSHPAWALLILINLLAALIVILIVRKKCRLSFYMTRRERARQRNRVLVAVLVLFGGLIGGIAAVADEWYVASFVGFAAFLLGILLLAFWSSPISITKACDGEFWIKGCGSAFLESLRVEYYADTEPI